MNAYYVAVTTLLAFSIGRRGYFRMFRAPLTGRRTWSLALGLLGLAGCASVSRDDAVVAFVDAFAEWERLAGNGFEGLDSCEEVFTGAQGGGKGSLILLRTVHPQERKEPEFASSLFVGGYSFEVDECLTQGGAAYSLNAEVAYFTSQGGATRFLIDGAYSNCELHATGTLVPIGAASTVTLDSAELCAEELTLDEFTSLGFPLTAVRNSLD